MQWVAVRLTNLILLHISKPSNAGWLLPKANVHSIAVYHPKKYPEAAWASFPPSFPFPSPQQCWRDTAPHRPPLPLPLHNKPFFFPFSPFLCPEPHEGPYGIPHTSSVQERGLFVQLRHLQHVGAFSSQERKPMQRKPRQAGFWERGCMPVYPTATSCQLFGPWPKGCSKQGGPASNKKAFQCSLGKKWMDHKAATKPFSQPLGFLGGL